MFGGLNRCHHHVIPMSPWSLVQPPRPSCTCPQLGSGSSTPTNLRPPWADHDWDEGYIMTWWMNRPTKAVAFRTQYSIVLVFLCMKVTKPSVLGGWWLCSMPWFKRVRSKVEVSHLGHLSHHRLFCLCFWSPLEAFTTGQHWKTLIGSSSSTKSSATKSSVPPVSPRLKLPPPHLFLHLGLSNSNESVAWAPGLPGEADDLRLHLANGGAVDLDTQLLLGDFWEKTGRNLGGFYVRHNQNPWGKMWFIHGLSMSIHEKWSTNHENRICFHCCHGSRCSWLCMSPVWSLPTNRRKVIVYSSFLAPLFGNVWLNALSSLFGATDLLTGIHTIESIEHENGPIFDPASPKEPKHSRMVTIQLF